MKISLKVSPVRSALHPHEESAEWIVLAIMNEYRMDIVGSVMVENYSVFPCCSDLSHVCWDENQQVPLGQNNPGCIRRDQRDNIGGVEFSA